MNDTPKPEFLIIDAHTSSGVSPEYVPLLKQGQISAYCLPIGWMKNARNTLDDVAYMFRMLEETAQDTQFVTTAAEIEAGYAAGKISVIMEFENTLPLDGDLHMVDIFHRLGLRMMQLAYNERNLVADGVTERSDAGLSDFGVQVIERMNKLGMLISLSHTSKRSCLETIEISQAPVVFSHSNAKALHDHPRNIDDELIEACARTGGVIGLNAIPVFLRPNPTADNPATLDDILDHIDYMVRVAGIDHVGLGFDLSEYEEAFTKTGVMSWRIFPPERLNRIFKSQFFPGIAGASAATGQASDTSVLKGVRDMTSIAETPKVVAGLRARGYKDDAVAKIMGLNFLRVFKAVWGG